MKEMCPSAVFTNRVVFIVTEGQLNNFVISQVYKNIFYPELFNGAKGMYNSLSHCKLKILNEPIQGTASRTKPEKWKQ